MKPQTAFVVSRKFISGAQIRVGITADELTPNIATGIEISMSTEDFITELVNLVGNPTFIVTKAQLAAKLRTAVLAIEEELKANTTQVVSRS